MLNYNRKQEKIALYRYKDVCNKKPRLQFNVTTQYAYNLLQKSQQHSKGIRTRHTVRCTPS